MSYKDIPVTTLKETCMNTLEPGDTNTWQRIQFLAGVALRHRVHSVDALADMLEAAKLLGVIICEDAGAKIKEVEDRSK